MRKSLRVLAVAGTWLAFLLAAALILGPEADAQANDVSFPTVVLKA